MGVIYILWLRELKRYTRSRAQMIASLGQPVLYLLALGFGMGPVYRQAGHGSAPGPGRIADGDAANAGLGIQRPGMDLQIAGDAHRPVQPGRQIARQRTTQPVPLEQGDKHRDGDDQQKDQAPPHLGRRNQGLSGESWGGGGQDLSLSPTPQRLTGREGPRQSLATRTVSAVGWTQC